MPGGGAPAGSSGSGAGSSANVYTPMAQPQADQLYQNIISSLSPLALDPTLTPAGQNYPAAQRGAGMVTGNPYFDQLTQYANQAVPYAAGLFGSAMGGQPQLDALGQYATSAMAGIPGQQSWYPAFQRAIETNPFISPAMTGQNLAGAYGAATASDAFGAGQNSFLDAQSIRSLFPQMTGIGNQIASQWMGMPAALGGQVSGFMGPTAGLAGKVGGLMDPTAALAGQVAAPMGMLQGAAGQILNAGFDPQNVLYNRTFDQLRNQVQAQNAMSGIGNTPYGASTVDNALNKFNVDWQNNLLNRMATAGGAAQGLDTAAGGLGQAAGGLYGQAGNLGATAGGLYGQAGNLGTAAGNLFGQSANIGNLVNNIFGQAGNTLGQATNISQGGFNLGKGATDLTASSSALPLGVYDQWLAQQLQAANAGVGAGATGAQTLGSLGGALGGALAGQQSLGGAGFQNLMNALQAPYNASNTQGGNILSAMSNLTNLGNNQYLMPQQVLNDLQSYLKLGQSASGLSGQLGALGQQQLMNSMTGVGNLAGTLFGGGGGGGGLGGLFGGGGGFGGGIAAGSAIDPLAAGALPFDISGGVGLDTLATAAPAAAGGGGLSGPLAAGSLL